MVHDRAALAAAEQRLPAGCLEVRTIRPERIHVATPYEPLSPGGNVLTVPVVSAAYLGDHYRYVVELGSSAIVIQSLTSIHDAPEVTIELPPPAIRVYPGEDG